MRSLRPGSSRACVRNVSLLSSKHIIHILPRKELTDTVRNKKTLRDFMLS